MVLRRLMRDKERPDELAGGSGRRRAGNEVEEAIQSKDQEDKAEKETGDDRSDFHGNILCLL